MPSFKSFKTGLLSRTKSSQSEQIANVSDDSPEGAAQRGVRLFCESGSPDGQGEEVLHLPVIVESAESSPAAATACAYQIRKFLSKEHFGKPHVQYNAVMLLRILSENPGPSFTRNVDKKFVDTTQTLLRTGKDPSVQQILRETLDAFEAERYNDEGLKKLLEMWRLNKGFKAVIPPQNAGWASGGQQNYSGGHGSSSRALPPPIELASRVEESKNTAKILMQLVQSTPTEEVLGNDLLKEFADRCQGAQRSMQGYINCDNPPPDDDTLQTLIEVTEQLSLSLSKHQRAVLTARRAAGLTTSNAASPDPESQGGQPVYANPVSAQDNYVPEPQSPTAASLQAARDRTAERERIEARERMEAREAEQDRQDRLRQQQHTPSTQYSAPAGPPPGRTEQDPFGDNAERSNYQQPRSTYEYRSDEAPAAPSSTQQQQPVTYRY
ncbi:hypothetical protein BDZ85DRAFT_128556 [Elsinoe ampelina]|uniref:GAT domain-containing protein n=1 Tax=Elsinoe ampelina TaxID=302913 RepID=A0A6A6G9N4_9PEZI|nr:hypothetical protein BDZ85DRAFT_128556 [Elsinoe ampelina]